MAKSFKSIEKLKNVSLLNLESISNIGPVVAKSIFQWFCDKDNLKLLDKLKKNGVTIKNTIKENQGRLSGKTFIFTGTLDLIDRNLAKERVRALGGETSESISLKISFVVAGKNPGSKLNKAKKMGLEIIDEKEFLGMTS